MIDKINWQKVNGLVPCIVQSSSSKQVLMLGYMNKDALKKTLSDGIVCFYSRTRQKLWIKGESSGNFLFLDDISLDCDRDSLVLKVNEQGPTCHLLSPTCFDNSNLSFLETLDQIISERLAQNKPKSYVRNMSAQGIARLAQKVGEEALETAIAASTENKTETLEEAGDLIFHLILLLKNMDLSLADVAKLLSARHYAKSQTT